MAFGAVHSDVLAAERILRSVVLLHAEERRLPPVHRVAFRAFAFFRTRIELAFVRIGLVAVSAVCERQRLLEVAVQMAFGAADGQVLAQQRIFGFGVVKSEGGQQPFPAGSRMTILATLLE